MLELVDEHLHQGTYTKQEVLQILGATDEQLLKTSLNGNTAHCEYIRVGVLIETSSHASQLL